MNSFNLNFILVIIFQLILYSGCTDKIQKNIENYKIVRYNESKNVTSLDPVFARNPQNIWPIQQIFNSLVQMDDSLNIKPEIASKWNISKDGLTYTFFLRNDVFFHWRVICLEKKKPGRLLHLTLSTVLKDFALKNRFTRWLGVK